MLVEEEGFGFKHRVSKGSPEFCNDAGKRKVVIAVVMDCIERKGESV